MLEWRSHAFKHIAIDIALGALHGETRFFVRITRCLADDATQARQYRVKGNHAGAHETFLQIGTDSGLLQQQGFVLTGEIFQRALKGGHIVGGLVQPSRQLLQR